MTRSEYRKASLRGTQKVLPARNGAQHLYLTYLPPMQIVVLKTHLWELIRRYDVKFLALKFFNYNILINNFLQRIASLVVSPFPPFCGGIWLLVFRQRYQRFFNNRHSFLRRHRWRWRGAISDNGASSPYFNRRFLSIVPLKYRQI